MFIKEKPLPRYNVGDEVRVVDRPYTQCPFTWVEEMTPFCGKDVIIREVRWSGAYREYAYEVYGSKCNWCENCFDTDDEVEFDVACMEEVYGLFDK